MPRQAPIAAALLFAAASAAEPARFDPRPLNPDDRPMLRPDPGAPLTAGGDVQGGSGAISAGRGDAALRGGSVSMSDDMNTVALLPTPLNLQQSNAVWTGAPITGRNRFLGTTVANRTAYATANDVAGDVSPKVRLMAGVPHSPDQFFFGFRYELLRSHTPLIRVGLQPAVAEPARLEHDLYVTSLDSMWTSEPLYVTTGFLVSRMMWGGPCYDCGGPIPPSFEPSIWMLGTNPETFLTGLLQQCRWINTAPTGLEPGDLASMPTGSWVRVRHEITEEGLVQAALDVNDGTGFHLIYSAPYLTGYRVDALGGNGSYEIANDPAYYDNFSAQGVEVTFPTPPTKLECGESGYLDDIQWLNAGPLKDQSELWFDALSSKANVDVLAGGDKVIRQTNRFPDNKHREEFTRTLPTVVATHGSPWTLCQSIRLSAGNTTVRAVAPVSYLDDSYVTRVALGHWDPEASPPYSGRVFVQHNPDYNPIDDEDSKTPYLPGPEGNGGVPRTGGAGTIGDPDYDYYDSGVSLNGDQATTLCITIGEENEMNVAYGAAPIVGVGSGVALSAFVHSIDEVRYESENQLEGHGDSFFVDDVHLDCFFCPAVSLPAFTLPHLDNLQWSPLNEPIGGFDDDCNPETSFRWSSDDTSIVVDLGAKSFALKMENIAASVTQTQGNFTLTFDASTRVPPVTPSPVRGYALGARFKLSDGLTTRAWTVSEAGASPGSYRANTSLLYSAGSGTFWALTPDPIDPVANEPVWTDTGATLADAGIAFNQWFNLTIHRNLDGSFIFKVNARALRDVGGDFVRTTPLQSAAGGVHENMDLLTFSSGDDAGGEGSILYADNIAAWALPCLGDTNDDGVVSFADINNLLGAFNSAIPAGQPPNVAPDADGDGVADDNLVNFADLNAALAQFGAPCD